jgi:hypothetical protein
MGYTVPVLRVSVSKAKEASPTEDMPSVRV